MGGNRKSSPRKKKEGKRGGGSSNTADDDTEPPIRIAYTREIICPLDANRFRSFIILWREILAGAAEKIRNTHVLPIPPENESDSQFADIKFRSEDDGGLYNCTCRFKLHDLYLVAFENNEGSWFSLKDSKVMIFGKELRLETSYKSMLNELDLPSEKLGTIQLTGKNIHNSIRMLSTFREHPNPESSVSTGRTNIQKRDLKIVAESLVTLMLSFAESVRFNSILERIVDEWLVDTGREHKQKEDVVTEPGAPWQYPLVRRWKRLSGFLLDLNRRLKDLEDDLKKLKLKTRKGRKLDEMPVLEEELGIAKRVRREDQEENDNEEKKKGKSKKGQEKWKDPRK